MTFRAVIFDWRGTLVTTLSDQEWVREALLLVGRDSDPGDVNRLLISIRTASGEGDRLEGPGVDSDADYHRRTYFEVFHDARCDDDLARALYAVESDARHNPFAADAVSTVLEFRRRGVQVAILSDIHFDVRLAFRDLPRHAPGRGPGTVLVRRRARRRTATRAAPARAAHVAARVR